MLMIHRWRRDELARGLDLIEKALKACDERGEAAQNDKDRFIVEKFEVENRLMLYDIGTGIQSDDIYTVRKYLERFRDVCKVQAEKFRDCPIDAGDKIAALTADIFRWEINYALYLMPDA